jgi:hypothetical protein
MTGAMRYELWGKINDDPMLEGVAILSEGRIYMFSQG